MVMCSFWAGNYFVIKNSLLYSSPIVFALLRSAGAGVVLTLIARKELKRITRNDVKFLLAIGFLQVTIFYIAVTTGLQTVNSSVAATLVYTQPVILVALSPLVGERLTFFKVLGVAAAFAGVCTIFLPALENSGLAFGDALELIASVSWVLSILVYKTWKHSLSHYVVPGVQNAFGAVMIIPFLSVGSNFLLPVPALWLDLAYIIGFSSVFGYAVYFRALSNMQASVFSSYLFMVPTLTTLFESILTLSLPGIYQIAGTILVSAGIIMVNREF